MSSVRDRMRRKYLMIAAAAAALQVPPTPLFSAAAEPLQPEESVPYITIPTELLSDATVTTDGGSVARLSAGDFLVPGDRWRWIDEELKRYQKETPRLEAENESMRESLRNLDPAWYWIAGAFATGIVVSYGYGEVKEWF